MCIRDSLGTLALSANGQYTYTVANSATQYLGLGETKIDTFTVKTADGTTKDVTFTISGTNDTPLIVAPTNIFYITPGIGGEITQVTNQLGGIDYVHTFATTGTSTFITPNDGVSAQLLVVAGGGSGGFSTNIATGGGGCGGVAYATNYDLVGSYGITVGGGGLATHQNSNNGGFSGNSSSIVGSDQSIIVYGGGALSLIHI